MELRHLRYFNEVANEMNFTKAAEKLHIAQPPLSKQIRDLEKELGVTLFDRRPHFMELTPEGTILKQYAVQILELADKAVETVREVGQGLNGIIHISASDGSTLQTASRWIAGFSALHPGVSFHIWAGSSDEILVRLRDGLCDLAIAQDIRNTPGIERHTLFHEPWCAMIPADHPLADNGQDTVDCMELLPYDLIIPLRPDRLDEVSSWYQDCEQKPRIRCRFSSPIVAHALTSQGVGIALCPGGAISLTSEDEPNRVILKTIRNPALTASFMVLTNKSRLLSNVTKEFVRYIRNETKELRA